MNKKTFTRILFYLLSIVILALGITLNTKTELGVSPIISTAFSVSTIKDYNFGNATLVLYTLLIVVEVFIHIFVKNPHAIIADILQFPLSLFFTRVLNLCGYFIPKLHTDLGDTWMGSYPGRIFFLAIAIILTGVGAALSMDMRIIPNPGDGIVQTISDACGKGPGLVKNCVDVTCVCFTLIISYIFAGRIIGIGIGTILAMIFVGRVIAAFNGLCKKKLDEMTGL